MSNDNSRGEGFNRFLDDISEIARVGRTSAVREKIIFLRSYANDLEDLLAQVELSVRSQQGTAGEINALKEQVKNLMLESAGHRARAEQREKEIACLQQQKQPQN